MLYVNEFSSLRSVAWHPTSTNIITVGTAAGDVYILDKREPKQFVTVYNCFDSNVHRMKFSDSGKLAVCGNVKDVLVFTCVDNALKAVYISQQHSDITRSLAWYEGDLYTCGFDGKILKHVI